MRAAAGEPGFSLIELLVSLALMVLVTIAGLAMLAPATTAGRTQPEFIDVQERGRIAQDVLWRDLYMAGAGLDVGPMAGPLGRLLPPVVPRRLGLQNADACQVARDDALTILYVPRTTSQTTLREPLSAGGSLRVALAPNCPPASLLCGLSVGLPVIVFDRQGHFDGFTVTELQSDAARVRAWQARHPPYVYAIGDAVAPIDWHTYYWDTAARQLRHYDGYLTDTPVVDDVVGLNVEYYADEGGVPARLPLTSLSDGPWRGDGENCYDADLLRIRRVRVRLRLQAGSDMLRGRGADFAIAGRSLSAARRLPDFGVWVDVAPRNLTGIR